MRGSPTLGLLSLLVCRRFLSENRDTLSGTCLVFVVVADADNAGHVVAVFLFVLEENVVLVVAEVDIVVAEIGQVVAAGLRLVVGVLQRNDIGGFLLGVELRAPRPPLPRRALPPALSK